MLRGKQRESNCVTYKSPMKFTTPQKKSETIDTRHGVRLFTTSPPVTYVIALSLAALLYVLLV